MSKKILVTGANGYLGQGIVRHLLDKGHTVIAVGRKTDLVDARAERITGDIFTVEKPWAAWGEPDVLFHLAWRDGFKHYSDAHIEDLPKHYRFIREMIDGGVKKIAVMGTMHEIGFYEGCIREDTPCRPVTPYGIGKNALRELTRMLCSQGDVLFQWLRGYYIVGNSRFGSSVFSKITAAVEEGKTEFPFTMGQNRYDFLDYEDFCEQAARAVTQDEILGVINLCSGQAEKLADRVERFIRDNGYSIRLLYGAFPDRPYDSKEVWGDCSKIDAIMRQGAEESYGTDQR